MPDVFTLDTIREAEATLRANETTGPWKCPPIIVSQGTFDRARASGIDFAPYDVVVSGQSCRRPRQPCER